MDVRLLAQELTRPDVCGAGADSDWWCRLVWDVTGGSSSVARFAAAGGTLVRVVIVVVVAFLVSRLASRVIARFAAQMERRITERLARAEERGAITSAERFRTRRFQRLHAITGVLRGVAGVSVWLVAALIVVVEVLDIALQPILAGAGLVSVVIGFGAQQMVRDVLAGIGMLVEDQYGVGDLIQIDDRIGEVERVGLRSTAFRDLDGIVWHVLNGEVQQVGNLSQHWSRSTLDVPVALHTDVPTAKGVIHKVATELAEDPVWSSDIIGQPEIWGVQDLSPMGITIRVVIPTRPMVNWDINRQLRERIVVAFERAGIQMPGARIELSGSPHAPPVLSRAVTEEDPAVASRPDTPRPASPEAAQRGSTQAERAAADELADIDETRDHTAELRLRRGPEPRPD